jgi:hypothetical protein
MAGDTIIPITVEGALMAELRNSFGPNAQIQESYIRVEKVLTAQDVSQTFVLTGGDGQKRPLENYISKNDLEVIYAVKIGFNKVIDAEDGNNANAVDYSYADLTTFAGPVVGTSQTEAACLESIYSGTWSLKSDTFEALNKQSLKKYRQVPRTQLEAGITQASFSGTESGFVNLLEPNIFSGQSDISLEIKEARGADVSQIGGPDGETNILFIHFLTLVIRNGAQSINMDNYPSVLKDKMEQGHYR